jgi:hypothetical protein
MKHRDRVQALIVGSAIIFAAPEGNGAVAKTAEAAPVRKVPARKLRYRINRLRSAFLARSATRLLT